MSDVRLRAAAVEDVRTIHAYSGMRFGIDTARRYLGGLRAMLDLAGKRPLAGRSEGDLRDGLRSLGYRSHRIYYLTGDGMVDVIRILHHAQDADLALGDPS